VGCPPYLAAPFMGKNRLNSVFSDTGFVIALINPKDRYHQEESEEVSIIYLNPILFDNRPEIFLPNLINGFSIHVKVTQEEITTIMPNTDIAIESCKEVVLVPINVGNNIEKQT
jgi:hypothetical protein